MADDMLEHEEKQEVNISPKPLRCRFHETEVYTIYFKDCNDFMCFKCICQLHQKHELSQLQDADEAIRTEMFEKRVLLELRNAFESYQTSLQEQKSNISNLQTEIANLDVNKLPEFSLSHIINSLSEMKLCSSTSDKLINHPKPWFQPTMEFSIGNLIETRSRKRDAGALPLQSSSNISTQTDYFEDSDTEWFDAEDLEEDNVVESSSDEITDEYPIKFQINPNIKRISKTVPISEKNAWIISDRKLLKIVDHTLQEDVYAETVDDIAILKDGCVLVLRNDKTFIMKLLPNRKLVRFADVSTINYYFPYCICIRDNIVVIYLWYAAGSNQYGYASRNNIIWMNTDGIVTKSTSFSESGRKRPCSIQNLELGLCVSYRFNSEPYLYSIELLDAKSDKCIKLYVFTGIYGMNQQRNFECGGMCADNAGNILVSDHRHHSVYVLDKELKYKNKLYDSKNELDKPTAISLLKDHIWVADGNQIFIFPYANE
ncbi:Hypothetical predicted protein [Mytilus galloprovincialis]|uniref:B box-type domain-containing protein n=1 Tax=Mytilus galloprovincialis TaxID=29158 RepID=A0A8B6HGH3_MYTGA|nr:Hypothetical predicted protein [Mytilus galloprovincialis]